MLKNMKLERAYQAPTRIEITVTEDGQPYVNIMNLNDGDAETVITAAIVGLADEMDLPIRDLMRIVRRGLWRVTWARRILGMAQRVAPEPDYEPQQAQIIEIVAH